MRSRSLRAAAANVIAVAVPTAIATVGAQSAVARTTEPTAPPAEHVAVGTWHRAQSCPEMVVAFEAVGLAESHREFMQGKFFPNGGPTEGDPCVGAPPWVEQAKVLGADGFYETRNASGGQDDAGEVVFVDEDTLSFPSHARDFGYDGEVLVDVHVDGDIVEFTVTLPTDCTGTCLDAYAWALTAFPPGPWERGPIPDRDVPLSERPPGGAADGTAAPIPTGGTYTSTDFVVPFRVTLPEWAASEPDQAIPNSVTFQAVDEDRGLRILAPVEVYAPPESTPGPLPDDYLAYLMAQTEHGATFTDVVETTVGGRPAMVLTATTDRPINGSLGCQELGLDSHDCFGLQPDVQLRLAVIDDGDQVLLIWQRDTAGSGAIEYESFDAMLASMVFI